jgi:hypothetical protein
MAWKDPARGQVSTRSLPFRPRKAIQHFTRLGKSDCAQSGDGTVPAPSGSTPGRHGVKRIYQLHDFDHQGSDKHEAVCGATVFAILHGYALNPGPQAPESGSVHLLRQRSKGRVPMAALKWPL